MVELDNAPPRFGDLFQFEYHAPEFIFNKLRNRVNHKVKKRNERREHQAENVDLLLHLNMSPRTTLDEFRVGLVGSVRHGLSEHERVAVLYQCGRRVLVIDRRDPPEFFEITI